MVHARSPSHAYRWYIGRPERMKSRERKELLSWKLLASPQTDFGYSRVWGHRDGGEERSLTYLIPGAMTEQEDQRQHHRTALQAPHHESTECKSNCPDRIQLVQTHSSNIVEFLIHGQLNRELRTGKIQPSWQQQQLNKPFDEHNSTVCTNPFLKYNKHQNKPLTLPITNQPPKTHPNPPSTPVPGSSMRFLEKSRTIQAIDSICYDLEDSVTPSQKGPSRQNILEILNRPRVPGIHEQAVRINSIDSSYALDDLSTILRGKNLDCIVIPKVEASKHLHFVTDMLKHVVPERHTGEARNPIKLIALVESAKSVMDLSEICKATPYLSGLTFAAEDFAMDLSITRTPDLHEFMYARSAIVTAARAHGLPSALDLVSTTFRGEEGRRVLREESENGKRFGFNGKQCIHPDQVEVVQEVFSPSRQETEWAVRVVLCDRKADEQGRGAWTLDGKMIDVPVVGKAKAIVAKAEVCGFDVQALMEKFKDEEPQ